MADAGAAKRSFLDFVDQKGYANTIRSLMSSDSTRLQLNLDDLRSFDPELASNFMRRPAEYLPAFEEGLRETVANFDPTLAKQASVNKFRIGVTGSFGSHHVTPRGLNSSLLNTLAYVEGIVTKCTLVRPKVVKSKHWCPATKKFTTKEYRDLTSLDGAATGSAYPTKDADGNLLQTEYGLSEYMDHQMLTLQEMPERAPPGQLPRSIDILVEADLVDKAKAGDRLQVAGIHRALPSKANSSGMFRTILLANNVRLLTKHLGTAMYTGDDIDNIKEVSKRSDCLSLLSESLAPSVFGHAHEKKALLMMLLGGVERNLSNGTHLRGDINVLMLGDPSTAKSQLLRSVLRTAPLAISTTGRGSSGVGLTAAVTTDDDTGCRRLEAGAMVLADRGVCCVDEFDKMLDADRVAIHEVMEQQTVTISKAGIHASLNARCSVVAAANPVFGSYDTGVPPMQNIGMPDSLLSRFDLLFVILDKKEAESDRRISKHVLRQHSSRHAPPPAEPAGVVDGSAGKADAAQTSEVYMKVDARTSDDPDRLQLSTDFIKKYINYAKQKVKPSLSDGAAKKIQDAYADLRDRMAGARGRTLPVTARTLETIIRLATAHAKCHLRGLILEEDAEAAVELLHYAILADELNPDADKKAGGGGGGGGGDDDDDDDDGGDDRGDTEADPTYRGSAGSGKGKRGGATPAGRKQQRRSAAGSSAEAEEEEGGAASGAEEGGDDAEPSEEKLAERVELARDVIGDLSRRRDEVEAAELLKLVRLQEPRFTMRELDLALVQLEEENQVMRREGVVHII